jgi:hypothetical protein
MPSPQVVAREPGRRTKKSNKPERRAKQPVDTTEVDFESSAPAQQSKKSGPGPSGGLERARRINERAPTTGGAKARAKPKDTTMMDKGIEKKMKSALRSGQTPANLATPENAVRKQPKAAMRRSAAPSEAAPTQKQVLRDKAPRKRTLRNEGVDSAQ